VVQEIFGVHEHIKDVCRRFAKAGYMAVAPSLYHASGRRISTGGQTRKFSPKVVSKVPDSQVMRDLDANRGYGRARTVATT
jgi:carboxymethylenebutenolidase